MSKKNFLLRSKIKKARALVQAGQIAEAGLLLEQIMKTERRDADVWFLLGFIRGKRGQHVQSAECFSKALELRSGDIQILYNLGIALRGAGNVEAALDAFQKVVKLQPNYNDAGACLADAYSTLGRLDESEDAFREALNRQPGNAELHSNLGSVLQAKGLVDEAVACYRKALQINPNLPAYDNYGGALADQCKFEEALAAYHEGLRRQPGNRRVYSNLLLTLNYMPDVTAEYVFKEHCRWGTLLGKPPGSVKYHKNQRNPERRLRVGYVSPDFRTHSVAYFIEPLLAFHNREKVEVFCYSPVPRPDETTERLRALADHWRDIHGLTDQQIVAQVQADKIDILVDLAGHTAHNSLTVFACKPSPIQVTYLGYPNTTGLPAIDYRLTDVVADPTGADEFYSEHLERLPDCFLCYQPLPHVPPVGELPAVENGYITFGSFNNLAKITPAVVALWSDVVKAVPESRLLVKNPSLTDPGRRAHYYHLFRSHGIGGDRVHLLGHTPSRKEHLALYGSLDIALDTFPYNGTTTTCEALWMGVPVLTIMGDRHAARVGASLLKCIELDDWIAESGMQFVARAAALSADLDRLADMRHGLRDRLAASPLCDKEAFAGKVEAAYQNMWHRWCESNGD